MRSTDGSAGDVNYGRVGRVYGAYRQPDVRIARVIAAALGDAVTVLNVGAGTGSYEPTDRAVTAVEPSASMRAQRAADMPAAIDAVAEHLPFDDDSFDAAMSTFSVHQWQDLSAGLREIRRVTRGPVVILTGDPLRVRDFWLYDYAPEVLDTEGRRYPSIDSLADSLGGTVTTALVPIPFDCTDGFNEAYYGRPEKFLEHDARLSCSAWSFVDESVQQRFAENLQRDLNDGTWDSRYGQLRTTPTLSGSLVLVTAAP